MMSPRFLLRFPALPSGASTCAAKGASRRASAVWFFGLAVVIALACGGCASWRRPPPAPETVARFLLEAAPEQVSVPLVLPLSGVLVRVAPKPVLSEFDIAEVALAEVDLGLCLAFRLTGAAARDLYRMSVSQMGKRLVLLVNGQALGARVLDGAIEGGVLFMFIEAEDAALPALVRDLNAAAVFLKAEAAKQK